MLLENAFEIIFFNSSSSKLSTYVFVYASPSFSLCVYTPPPPGSFRLKDAAYTRNIAPTSQPPCQLSVNLISRKGGGEGTLS